MTEGDRETMIEICTTIATAGSNIDPEGFDFRYSVVHVGELYDEAKRFLNPSLRISIKPDDDGITDSILDKLFTGFFLRFQIDKKSRVTHFQIHAKK